MRLINAESKVHVLAYDDEHEENVVKYMTIEELLDEFTEEGCINTISDSVQHGRWETEVRTNRHGTRSCLYACSLCGILSIDEFWYCPHCGARMDEEEQDAAD